MTEAAFNLDVKILKEYFHICLNNVQHLKIVCFLSIRYTSTSQPSLLV